MCVGAAILSNLGTNMQKSALDRRINHKEGKNKILTYLIWGSGLLLIIVGSFGDFGALGFGGILLFLI